MSHRLQPSSTSSWMPPLAFAMVSLACGTESGRSVQDLVGAPDAPPAVAKSTLQLRYPGCTAARVGSRHILTAAHCVDGHGSGGVRPEYAPGASIWVTGAAVIDKAVAAADPAAAGYLQVQIEQTHVAPPWRDDNSSRGGSPDMAVVVLTPNSAAALAGIAIAPMDFAPVLGGDAVVLTGYGEGSSAHSVQPSRRLRSGQTIVLSEPEPSSDRVLSSFFATDAQQEPRLEAGDSGGPVYRWGHDALAVVGINSTTLIWGRAVDTHTRLDRAHEFDTASWLQGIVDAAPAPVCEYRCADYGTAEGACLEVWQCTDGCLQPFACCQYACGDYGFAEGECREGWQCQNACLRRKSCTP